MTKMLSSLVRSKRIQPVVNVVSSEFNSNFNEKLRKNTWFDYLLFCKEIS